MYTEIASLPPERHNLFLSRFTRERTKIPTEDGSKKNHFFSFCFGVVCRVNSSSHATRLGEVGGGGELGCHFSPLSLHGLLVWPPFIAMRRGGGPPLPAKWCGRGLVRMQGHVTYLAPSEAYAGIVEIRETYPNIAAFEAARCVSILRSTSLPASRG